MRPTASGQSQGWMSNRSSLGAPIDSDEIASAPMTSGVQVPPSAARHFQPPQIIRALESSGSHVGRDRTEPWLQAIRGRSQELAGALRDRDLKYAPSIFELARTTDPDAISSDGQGDPWYAAVTQMTGDLTTKEILTFPRIFSRVGSVDSRKDRLR